ncbi:MAG: DUF1015 domain-containing protein, partial [Propionibacteriaceae bacterium]|nr:DUF1015 domain-containing protein [Propionibacteriaceae bacterium]
MPDFRSFRALRYEASTDLKEVLAPPYDVLSESDVKRLHRRDPHNICRVDMPAGHDYDEAAELLWSWVKSGDMVLDAEDALTIYRLRFTDATGEAREITGVLGALEVVNPQADLGDHISADTPGVLPHERVTPKASTDRLELTRATKTNLSPVWGLSLANGLTAALAAEGERLGAVEFEGVVHQVERITDPTRIEAIRAIIADDDVLIADGHHRYGVAQIYRDEVRQATGRTDTDAEYTLAFVNELVEDQLSIEAIHRLYSDISADDLRERLGGFFTFAPVEELSSATLAEMVDLERLVLVWPDGEAEWLIPIPGAFEALRELDGVWLETALDGLEVDVEYQHGLEAVQECLEDGDYTAAVLIRP